MYAWNPRTWDLKAGGSGVQGHPSRSEFKNAGDLISRRKKKDDGSLLSDAPSSSSLFTSAHLTHTLTTQLYSEKNCENIIFPFTECLGVCAGMPH